MVSMKPKGNRWRIEIYFRWPDGVPYRKRLLAPVTAKSAALRWGQQYEANVLAEGREALKSPATEGSHPRPAEPVEQYAKRWLDEREGRVHSIRDDRSRMRLHVLPTLGPLDARTFTRDDIEYVRDALDEKITNGTLAWKTAASCWTLVTSMCADMVSAKKRELRIRDNNPCRDVKPPERGARKAKQYLYPSEFLQFVSSESIPLRWRRAVTLAIYTYTRDGELRVLQWNDLEHAVINVIRAHNRRKPGEIKGPKSDAPRRFAVEPNLRPLLDAMRMESDGRGLVIELASERAMARNFRRWLWKAGVKRAALHETNAQSQNITWHDLRATGATWMAVRGDDPLKIMQRCGHRDYGTTLRYIREAEAVRDGFGEPFPALPRCLLESPWQPSNGTPVARAASDNENLAFSRGI
jgi:integrase